MGDQAPSFSRFCFNLPVLIFLILLCYHAIPTQGFVPQARTSTTTTSSRSSLIEFSDFLKPKGATPPSTTTTVPNNKIKISKRSLSSQLHALPTATITATTMASLESSQYLVRIVFLRALALVYFVAFSVAYNQNKALIGDNGITPARYLLEEAKERAARKRKRREAWMRDMTNKENEKDKKGKDFEEEKRLPFKDLLTKFLWQLRKTTTYQRIREVLWDRADLADRPITTILWLAKDFKNLNPWLDGIAITGLAVSGLVMALGAANVPLLLTLWICQRSLMAVGGPWYGYGWEPQLAELGMHALFMVPLLSLDPMHQTSVPQIVSWTIRWYLFRIMLGAGLIKMKSADRKWKDLTTMDYFYETQPVPSLLTRSMHFMPKAWHKFEVLTNHFVELVAPFFILFPIGFLPKALRFAGLFQVGFQFILISTGNLSFLNWLTIVPALMCLDDAYVSRLFSADKVQEAAHTAATYMPSLSRTTVSCSFGALVMWLSVPVIQNLLARRQRMNGSFDRLRLINTYGAFGVVSENRDEFVIESSPDGVNWKEYVFKVKPGPLDRRPRWITPYHYRLDWQMWIAAQVRTLERSPWIFRFLYKLLQEDKDVLELLDHDPWEGDQTKKPKYIRVNMYRYRFHKGWGAPHWERAPIGRVYPRQGSYATMLSLSDEISYREPNRPL